MTYGEMVATPWGGGFRGRGWSRGRIVDRKRRRGAGKLVPSDMAIAILERGDRDNTANCILVSGLGMGWESLRERE